MRGQWAGAFTQEAGLPTGRFGCIRTLPPIGPRVTMGLSKSQIVDEADALRAGTARGPGQCRDAPFHLPQLLLGLVED